ncbi:hypothetical protein ACFPU0_22850 [Pseudomonas sp. GCM10022186]|uniref:hypothetical protein n=1 Tax=Pseudomonas sp. GCM10022186 TaxID=3252650 RepID=UPI0036170796
MTKNLLFLSPSEAADRSTTDIVSQIKTYLREIAKELWSEESYSSLNLALKELSSNKSITWTNISSCWKSATIEKDPTEARDSKTAKIHFAYASLYYHNALAKKIAGDEQKVASLAVYAAYHIGALDTHTKTVKTRKRNKARAKSGGLGKSEILKKIRTYLVKLLETPPAGGWKDIPSTAHILAPMLEEFIISNNFGKVVYDSAKFIISEIEEDGKPQETFRKNKKKL